MKISEYVNSKTAKYDEIKENFILEKVIDKDAYQHKGCFNCEDELNQNTIKSEPWTATKICRACNRINFIIFSDRMGGSYTDTIEIYKEK